MILSLRVFSQTAQVIIKWKLYLAYHLPFGRGHGSLCITQIQVAEDLPRRSEGYQRWRPPCNLLIMKRSVLATLFTFTLTPISYDPSPLQPR